jgi:protocatechuate 3,4-dioxygenase, beta subunit
MQSKPFEVRRRTLRILSLGGIAATSGWGSALAQTIKRTAEEIAGPFYPVLKPLDQDADLTVVAGKTGRAQGKVIQVVGRVLDVNGEPVKGARVELWQANTFGRYTHPSDRNPAPLDPNFEGFGVQTSDAEGRYRFKTIKPGAYPATPTWTRPAHLHFEVTAVNTRLTTQMYFPDDPHNEKDRLLQALWNKEGAMAKVQPNAAGMESDSLLFSWDIVLARA